jgi:hypothetical protein
MAALLMVGGCGAQSLAGPEEQGRGSAQGGKADDLGFVAGYYLNVGWSEGEGEGAGEPVVAIFHQPDGTEPEGTAGRFDLSRHRGEYEFEYLSGYYELSQDRDGARVRLLDVDGAEVASYGWSYASRALTLDEVKLILVESPSATDVVSCLVVDVVDSSVYEESLSVYEYPFVSVERAANGAVTLWIGSSVLEAPDAAVTLVEQDGAVTATATRDGYQDVIRVPGGTLRRGEILAGAAGDEPQLVARIVCRP